MLYLVPTIILFFVGHNIVEVDPYKIRLSTIETLLLSLLIFFGIIITPFLKNKFFLFVIGYLIMVLTVFIQLSYYSLYQDRINSSTIYILIETNLAESKEFFEVYFGWFNFLLLILLISPIIFFRLLTKTREAKNLKIISVMLIFAILFVYHNKSLAKHNLFYTTWTSYEQYVEQTRLYDEFGIHKKEGNFKEVKITPSVKRKLFVLIIGESTTRHRMGLYGYPRQTNPELTGIEEQLVIFQDVISPHTHTIPSLGKMLSLNHYENENRLIHGTLIQLMNQAGLETYWISNQKPVGLHENFVTKIANASSNLHFLNVKNYNVKSHYDEVVLSPLKKIVKNNEDMFVVIHLLGTHTNYADRYPPEFAQFNEIPPLMNNMKGMETINHYDNAILYNDHIVNGVIKEVKKEDALSYVLYLSDHGEDVFLVKETATHTESNGTYPMYDVPFVLWQSREFKEEFSFNFEPDKPYMLDDLIYSLADLSGIRFQNFEPERSIFNDAFKYRPRSIFKNKDYDSIFKK